MGKEQKKNKEQSWEFWRGGKEQSKEQSTKNRFKKFSALRAASSFYKSIFLLQKPYNCLSLYKRPYIKFSALRAAGIFCSFESTKNKEQVAEFRIPRYFLLFYKHNLCSFKRSNRTSCSCQQIFLLSPEWRNSRSRICVHFTDWTSGSLCRYVEFCVGVYRLAGCEHQW